VPGGPSARCLFSPVLRVFIVFLLAFILDSVLFKVFVAAGLRTVRASIADGPDPVRTVRLVLADSPFFRVRLWWFCWLLRTVRGSWPDCPRGPCGLSMVPGRTVRVVSADNPPLLAGQSASAWQLCSLVRFLPPSFVLPRVLQGIVPKT
jgi:hypothetical protein